MITRGGAFHFFIFINDFSRMIWVHALAHKSDYSLSTRHGVPR